MENIWNKSSYRYITVQDKKEAKFVRRFITGSVTVGINQEFTGFAIDKKTVIIYRNKKHMKYIAKIFNNDRIEKIITRPLGAIKNLIGENLIGKNLIEECNMCKYIGDCVNSKRSLYQMKLEIIEQGKEKEDNKRAGNVALIAMKYKMEQETETNKIGKEKCMDTIFNKKRECYLIYMTAYNDILSRDGLMKYTDLTVKVMEYKDISMSELHPAMALEGLIKTGALKYVSEFI